MHEVAVKMVELVLFQIQSRNRSSLSPNTLGVLGDKLDLLPSSHISVQVVSPQMYIER